MGNTFFFEWEVNLMEWLQRLMGSGFWVKLWSIFSTFGEEFACVAVMGFFYWGLNKEIGKYLGVNIAVSTVWNPLIKNVFLRRRPYFDNPGIKILKPVDKDADLYDIAAQGFSFPSGHSSNSTAVFASLFVKAKNKSCRILLLLVPLLVGISRFVLGAHYPTDVLAGWALGAVVVTLVPLLQKKLHNDYLFFGILLLVGLPGFFFCKSNDFFTGYGILLGAAAGFFFEQRFVKFENTKNYLIALLRTVVGGGLFFGLNTLFKLPFSSVFLDSPVMGAYLVRTFRYAIVIFIVAGLYPMIFKYTSKIVKKAA